MHVSFSSSCTGATVYATFLAPLCERCGAASPTNTVLGLLCQHCIEEHNRRIAIANAVGWMTSAFCSCSAGDQRAKLYRTLAAIFHPDAGGNEELMKALNDVREKFA